MSDEVKQFPVLMPYSARGTVVTTCPRSVPWALVAPHASQALANHSQTLERLAERGGLSPTELVALLDDRAWTPMDLGRPSPTFAR